MNDESRTTETGRFRQPVNCKPRTPGALGITSAQLLSRVARLYQTTQEEPSPAIRLKGELDQTSPGVMPKLKNCAVGEAPNIDMR